MEFFLHKPGGADDINNKNKKQNALRKFDIVENAERREGPAKSLLHTDIQRAGKK